MKRLADAIGGEAPPREGSDCDICGGKGRLIHPNPKVENRIPCACRVPPRLVYPVLTVEDEEGRDEPRCGTCLDGRFVTRVTDRHDPNFGKAFPCPRCSRGVSSESEHRMNLPPRYANASLASQPPKPSKAIWQSAVEWAKGWPPKTPFLLLTGPVGTGKTHLAVALLRHFAHRYGTHGKFVSVPSALDRLRDTYDDDSEEKPSTVMGEYTRCPILVLDDFGAEKSTEYALDRMFQVVDQRYNSMRPTLITTNRPLTQLENRVLSRITAANDATVLDFAKLPDYRKEGR